MNRILVDTSIWIDWFKGTRIAQPLLKLIENNEIVVNDLILAELIPFLNEKEDRLIELLQSVRKVTLPIDWAEIIAMQTTNLKNGINKVGIPDLIIVQNALVHNLILFENDRHFELMQKQFKFKLFRNQERE